MRVLRKFGLDTLTSKFGLLCLGHNMKIEHT